MLAGVVLLGALAMASWPAQAQDAPPAAPAPEEIDSQGAQVLTRGPVHEAFATPVVHDPAPGPVVPKEPPAPVPELAPDQKPAGQNVQWIPGYWSWDGARNDFLWVSGIWRETPPSGQWVPGYWNQVEGGYQWVPGTWVPVPSGQNPSQPAYLPAPPQSLEAGPNSPQPSANVSWTPGYWSWQGSGYAWRPGFWAAVQPNWIWTPAHYVWTPSGYLFVAGYWDVPLANRGLMFAPVYYPRPVYLQAGFTYTPGITIGASAMMGNLFVQASTNQYLFGDFYAQSFVSVGITPWFSFTFATGPPVFYDPLFSYYAVINVRQNPAWVTQVREQYVLRRDNVAMRPPRTYFEQTRFIERNVNITRNVNVTRNVTIEEHRNMAVPLEKLASESGSGRGMKLVKVEEAERRQIQHQVAQLHEYREQRLQQEREVARTRASGGSAASRPHPMNLPHSPIAGRAAAGHAAAARTEIAHRPEAERPGGQHPGAAHRPEFSRQPSREAALGAGRRPMAPVEPQRRAQPRPEAGAGAFNRRPAPGGAEGRPQGRAPARREPRQPANARSREEERRPEP
jgi:hypothetical protein